MDKVEETVKPTRTRSSRATKEKTIDDVKPTDRCSIDNLCDWSIGFASYEMGKDIMIPPSVKNYRNITVGEVDAQVKTGNVVFCGTDSFGAHAPIRINDPVVREYVFGESVNPVQLTEDEVKKLLAIQDKKKFNATLSKLVVRESEKRMIVRMVENLGVDDVPSYQIAAIEKVSGRNFG